MNRHVRAVDPTGGAEFRTIGEALAGASDGAVLSLAPGRYDEQLVLSRVVTLMAAEGPGTVEILCSSGTAVTSVAEAVKLTGLVLRGLGIQVTTTTATSAPRFIPTDKIRDVLLNEAFRGFEVRAYLVVVVEGEADVVVVFPRLLPLPRIVEKVWRGVRACLWEVEGGNTTTTTAAAAGLEAGGFDCYGPEQSPCTRVAGNQQISYGVRPGTDQIFTVEFFVPGTADGPAPTDLSGVGFPQDLRTGPITIVFTAMWLGAAWLFRRAAREAAGR